MMMNWDLEDLTFLPKQPFTSDIETLPLHFEEHHWERLYNNGNEWHGNAFTEIKKVIT
jgi:hypothetical protein